MDSNKVQQLIFTIENAISDLKKEIALNPTVNIKVNGPATIKVGGVQEIPPIDIKSIIDSPEWAQAVDPDTICSLDNEQEKTNRAETILDMTIDSNLQGLRFLDYGCGEGHIAISALNRGALISVGYDPFAKFTNKILDYRVCLTSSEFSLEPNGYDVILLYDVLDHCYTPVETLKHINKLLAEDGSVYVICHPWTSRHGGHLYRQFNKAFAHLWLNEKDLSERGISSEFTRPISNPLVTYQEWFKNSGFVIQHKEVTKSEYPLESFFRDNHQVWDRLKRHFIKETDDEICSILEIEFVLYILQKVAS